MDITQATPFDYSCYPLTLTKENIKQSGAKALCFFTVYSHLRWTWSFAPRDFTKPCGNAAVRSVDDTWHNSAAFDPWWVQRHCLFPRLWQFVEDKRETPERDNLTYTLTGKRELERLSSAWDMFMCLCRRPGRKITQPEIYTGKMRLVQRSQAYWVSVKNCFTRSDTEFCSPVVLMVRSCVCQQGVHVRCVCVFVSKWLHQVMLRLRDRLCKYWHCVVTF